VFVRSVGSHTIRRGGHLDNDHRRRLKRQQLPIATLAKGRRGTGAGAPSLALQQTQDPLQPRASDSLYRMPRSDWLRQLSNTRKLQSLDYSVGRWDYTNFIGQLERHTLTEGTNSFNTGSRRTFQNHASHD